MKIKSYSKLGILVTTVAFVVAGVGYRRKKGGKAAQSWHQKTRNKPVIEIRRGGHSLDVFEDYLEFT